MSCGTLAEVAGTNMGWGTYEPDVLLVNLFTRSRLVEGGWHFIFCVCKGMTRTKVTN